MRNGVRHVLGAGAGLAATPLIAAGFLYSASQDRNWLATGALVAAMVLVGALCGSRISPLASLVPGLAFAGTAIFARTPWAGQVRADYAQAYLDLIDPWSLPAGAVLLAASVFPARWRGAERPEPVLVEEPAPAPPPLPKRIPSRY